MKKVFVDTEFTGLHQSATLISLGMISEDGETFYAEFTDYDQSQIDNWLQENIVDKTLYKEKRRGYKRLRGKHWRMKGTSNQIASQAAKWLNRLGKVQMVSDCLSYDQVLFNQLYGGAFGVQKAIQGLHYIWMDICTMMDDRGIDPDTSREEFVGVANIRRKHNALHDAWMIMKCYYKLKENSLYEVPEIILPEPTEKQIVEEEHMIPTQAEMILIKMRAEYDYLRHRYPKQINDLDMVLGYATALESMIVHRIGEVNQLHSQDPANYRRVLEKLRIDFDHAWRRYDRDEWAHDHIHEYCKELEDIVVVRLAETPFAPGQFGLEGVAGLNKLSHADLVIRKVVEKQEEG